MEIKINREIRDYKENSTLCIVQFQLVIHSYH